MLQDGITEESTNPWSSLIIIVPKLDGSLWLLNNFWRLNKVSYFDTYSLPQVDDLIECIWSAQFIYTLVMTKGY